MPVALGGPDDRDVRGLVEDFRADGGVFVGIVWFAFLVCIWWVSCRLTAWARH
jgi:hypothetical protein